jgi:hypothetical protein
MMIVVMMMMIVEVGNMIEVQEFKGTKVNCKEK